MNDETRSDARPDDSAEASGPNAPSSQSQRRELLPLPGLAAIALYMLVLAGVSILGVANGQFRSAYLIFSAFFITAALGLLRLFRWAWALALGAVVLLVTLFTWKFLTEHQYPFLVQGLLNLVFFLYLVRTEVRGKLR
jgi:hypothetical protein